MLEAGAQVEAKRRRATMIDAPDYESAVDSIINPSRRRDHESKIADVTGGVGSALVGYSANFLFASGSGMQLTGVVTLACGAAMMAVAYALKYWSPST